MTPVPPPSVRLAMPVEAAHIATIQRSAWPVDQPAALAEAFAAEVSLEAATQAWQRAIVAPPLAQFRVLVAVAEGDVVGYAVVGPADDPDAEPTDGQLGELVVDPSRRRQGHGSRLLHACADTLRADGFARVRVWLPTTADVLRAFLTAQGFAPDGAHQELGTDSGATAKLLRLHASLA